MTRNERTTCKELIEPSLTAKGWNWDEQLINAKTDGSQRPDAPFPLKTVRPPLRTDTRGAI